MLSINLIGKSNGVGLTRDLVLLEHSLREIGCRAHVTVVDRAAAKRRRSVPRQLMIRARRAVEGLGALRRRAPRYDVNIMLEHIWPEYLHLAARNVLIPNPEWFDRNDRRFPHTIDRFWAKTRTTADICARFRRPVDFIGFDSEDRYTPDVPRERTFLHVAGKSMMKGTDRILETWQRNPGWPTLLVVQHASGERQIDAPNIRLISGYIDDGMLRTMQNASMYHLCPSRAEGWGHYIVEAMSAEACVVTVDAAPMNELVTPERGVLVRYGEKGQQKLAATYEFDAADLEHKVIELLRMPIEVARLRGAAARAWYLQNRQAFPDRLAAALEPLRAEARSRG